MGHHTGVAVREKRLVGATRRGYPFMRSAQVSRLGGQLVVCISRSPGRCLRSGAGTGDPGQARGPAPTVSTESV